MASPARRRPPPETARPKPEHVLTVWTPEGFKPVEPKRPRRAESRMNRRPDSLNVLLNKFMDPKEEAFNRKREAEAVAKRMRRFEGTTPGKIRERESNPLTLEHERYRDPEPNFDAVYSRYKKKRELDRARYDPISHHFAEPDVDAYVASAETSRRDHIASIKESRQSTYDPIVGVNADGTPASPETRQGKARVVPSYFEPTARVLTPSPAMEEISQRRRESAAKMTATRAGYNPLNYDSGSRAASALDFASNPNGLTPISRSRSGKSNRSGVGYHILHHATAAESPASPLPGRVIGGTRVDGWDPISRTSSSVNKSRYSFNIITGADAQ